MLIITLTSITLIGVFVILGFGAFVTAIKNQRTCEWANFDNIEMHAQVDVPKVINSDCNYDKPNNIKKVLLTIDKSAVDLDKYVQSNNLQKLAASSSPQYSRYLRLEKDSLQHADLYYRKTESNGEQADILLDKLTGRLWVTIKYKG